MTILSIVSADLALVKQQPTMVLPGPQIVPEPLSGEVWGIGWMRYADESEVLLGIIDMNRQELRRRPGMVDWVREENARILHHLQERET